MEFRKHSRVFLFFVFLHLIILAKVILFYQKFGFGQITHFNKFLFPKELYLINSLFHETMHVLILIAAFVFAKQLLHTYKEINDWKLFLVVVVGAIMHNSGYWFTRSYETFFSIITDFVFDVVTLFAIIITSTYLIKKHSFFRKIKFPFLNCP